MTNETRMLAINDAIPNIMVFRSRCSEAGDHNNKLTIIFCEYSAYESIVWDNEL